MCFGWSYNRVEDVANSFQSLFLVRALRKVFMFHILQVVGGSYLACLMTALKDQGPGCFGRSSIAAGSLVLPFGRPLLRFADQEW